MQNEKNNELSFFRSLFVLFYYYVVFLDLIPQLVYKLQINNGIITSGMINIEYQVLAYLLGLIPIVVVMIPFLKREKRLNIKKFILTLLFVIVLSILCNMFFQTLVKLFNHGEFINSHNQDGLNLLMSQNIMLHHFMVIFLAPILEELVFRGALFNLLKTRSNDVGAYFISSFLFGLIHVPSLLITVTLIDLIYLFLYAGLGFLFCFAYKYNESIYACILIHIIYNAFTVFS